MTDDSVRATLEIEAAAAAIFAVLADPTSHAAIDGTGWVRDARDGDPLSAAGQVFRVAMFHPSRPVGDYEMANQVEVFDAPNAIAWKPGYATDDGTLAFGGWVWRYDLAPTGPSSTSVTLSYDWSAVPDPVRARIGFPPFPPDHLANSLVHLAELVAS